MGVVCALIGAAVLLFSHGFVLTHGSRATATRWCWWPWWRSPSTVIIKPQLERLGTLVVMGWYYIIGLAVTAPFFWKPPYSVPETALQAQAELAYILILARSCPWPYRGTEKLTSSIRHLTPAGDRRNSGHRPRSGRLVDQSPCNVFIFAGVVLVIGYKWPSAMDYRPWAAAETARQSASRRSRHASGRRCRESNATITERLSLHTVAGEQPLEEREALLPIFSQVVVTRTLSCRRI